MLPGQLLQYMFGSFKSTSRREFKTTEAKLNAFLKDTQKDLRDQIESTLPVLYLVDVDVLLSSLFKAIHPNSDTLTRYIKSLDNVYIPEFEQIGNAFPELTDSFKDLYIPIYNKLLEDLETLKVELIQAINSSINKRVSIDTLSKEVSKTLEIYNKKIAAVIGEAKVSDNLSPEQSGRASAAIRFTGAKIREISGKYSPGIFIDPEIFLNGYNSSSQVLLVGSNYQSLVRKVNRDILTPALELIFSRYSISVNTNDSGFKAGNFAAAGHTALLSDRSANSVIGINTPLLQSIILLASNQGIEIPGLTTNFIKNTAHKDLGLVIKKDFTPQAQNLLSAQFSILISTESSFNSKTLVAQELAAAEAALKSVNFPTYIKFRKELIKFVASKEGIKKFFRDLRFSPTILEDIEDQIVSELLDRKSKSKRTKVGKAVTDTIIPKLTNVKLNVVKIQVKKITNPIKKVSTPGKVTSATSTKTTNLTSLQNLLNASLVEQVKQNMGRGNRTDILNLRTGRFAESVKVERMSESRQGMITAFYSYMKNPYATFSQGGRQQNPRSRDPKLLIAKSIRELAKEQVANRLRAVVV